MNEERSSPLTELLAEEGTLLLDGAMGTMLMEMGLGAGNPPEEWNVLYPERIQGVHQQYVEAGSRLLLTNSFGGNRFRLALHGLEERVFELNQAAAENARRVANAAPSRVLVAGSMGPTGSLFEPLGTLTFAEAQAAFAEQAAGLAAGGADLLWIETMSDLEEVRAAVAGAREATELPIAASMTFDTNRHTMMGVSPERAVAALGELGLVALGANCGNGPDEIEEVIARMRALAPGVPLIAKANAGIPHFHGNELVYDGTPELMGAYAAKARQLGAALIGGCCGNTPVHIARMAAALAEPAEGGPDARAPVGGQDTRGPARQRRHRRQRN
jgi:5-methyltetrahydrofolate--homocysteine methyltransferase